MVTHELGLDRQETGSLPWRMARRSSIDPFSVMDVMGEANARAAAGEDIIHMEVGQPAAPTPKAARERAREPLEMDRLGYTEALGLLALRERIAHFDRERYGVSVTPERVVVTAGSAGFVLAFLAVLDPGDTLLVPAPGPCYRQIPKALGARPILVETGAETRWCLPLPTSTDSPRRTQRASCSQARTIRPAPGGGLKARGACRRLQALRALADLRRDLSRPQI